MHPPPRWRRWSRPSFVTKSASCGGYYVGVPVVLGAGGVERIIELELTGQEKADFQHSVDAVKKLVARMNELTG